MLIRRNAVLEGGVGIKITKTANGRDVSSLGAFRFGTTVTFSVRLSRALGVRAVVMRLSPDGGENTDSPFAFSERCGGEDVYRLSLDTARLCQGENSGLFYYEILLVRDGETRFTNSINNVDFELSDIPSSRFCLLVYAADFSPAAWFRGGTMYHVFLDRFFKGEGEVTLREGARLDQDWESGIPQYAKRQGDPLSNDVFFGGNLWGVMQQLDYLASLGVTVLYLSPIFEARSNHRYDTGDYERIDGLLGGEAAFSALVEAAHGRGMRIILDGVFNHTGDDSRYFNRRSTYATLGAYQSEQSPYADWYTFRGRPDGYECWWGIEILPRLNHESESCRRYFTGEDGIAANWLRAGADGWRLDVADELCDRFLDELRRAVQKETKGEGILIGEVWENAVEKISYGKRRRYFWGGQLDSVMNYPFRNAVLAFLREGDATTFYHILTELYGTYPIEVSHSLMNLLGTHDTERILTLLGTEKDGAKSTNDVLARKRLSKEERARAIELLKIGAILQYTVFGVPSLYYGDEAGMEGYHDPFCRMPYPWGREEKALVEHYRALGRLRREHAVLAEGEFCFVHHDGHSFAFERRGESETLLVAANMGEHTLSLPTDTEWKDAFTDEPVEELTVPPKDCKVWYR